MPINPDVQHKAQGLEYYNYKKKPALYSKLWA